MTSQEDIERLIEGCQAAERGVTELSKGLAEFANRINKQSIFVKPWVRRDFKSNTGMNVEEWKRFAERLHARFTSIESDAKKVLEAYEQQRSEDGIHTAITTLRATARPFIDSGDIAIKTIEGFATYLESVPKKLEMDLAKQFLKEEEKNKLIEAIPENVETVRGLANLLRTIKDQLIELM